MKRHRILIVEDDHNLANMYRMSLAIGGFDVMTANRATATIPVIVVTGSDMTHAARQASAILRKPCAPELLLSAVENRLHAV